MSPPVAKLASINSVASMMHLFLACSYGNTPEILPFYLLVELLVVLTTCYLPRMG